MRALAEVIADTSELYAEDVQLISKNGKLYYLPENKAERGTVNGKICTSGDYCNDTVTRTTEWTGYIALPYITDYAYASSESICETNMQAQDDSNNYICKNNNWINNRSTWTWYLTPSIGSGGSDISNYEGAPLHLRTSRKFQHVRR